MATPSPKALPLAECQSTYATAKVLGTSLYVEGDRLRRKLKITILGGLLSAGTGVGCRYYYTSPVHRVWRIRNPSYVGALIAGQAFSVFGTLTAASIYSAPEPYGLKENLESLVNRIAMVDEVAYQALEMEEEIRLEAGILQRDSDVMMNESVSAKLLEMKRRLLESSKFLS